jgi:DNA primase
MVEHFIRNLAHASKFTPWEIRTAMASKNKGRAAALERYLKSGSGRAFFHRHLSPHVR